MIDTLYIVFGLDRPLVLTPTKNIPIFLNLLYTVFIKVMEFTEITAFWADNSCFGPNFQTGVKTKKTPAG